MFRAGSFLRILRKRGSFMEIRKAAASDLSKVMEIIESGRVALQKQGLPQWQNGHGPDAVSMGQMIEEKCCYLALVDEEVVAVGCLVTGVDPVYTAITNGSWTEAGPYLSIHRFAVISGHTGQGIGRRFLTALVNQGCQLGYQDLRIDTHPDNQGMIQVIESCGFVYRGDVQFPIPHGERVAYQLLCSDC